jgi:16S rRNA (cytidine1402-2'-O)-methyltransferase
MEKGKLYLIPTPISGNGFHTTLIKNDIEIVSNLKFFIVETPKKARSFLSSINLKNPIQKIEMKVFDEHSSLENIQEVIQPLLAGKDMGLMTDAGTPCIADPGEEIVLMCHRLGVEIIPMIGPSSIMLALMASGLDGEKFTFNGYLPRKPHYRQRELKKLEDKVFNNKGTQIFIEAPYRNQVMFNDIMKLNDDLYLCIGQEIGSQDSSIITKPIKRWKKEKILLDKVPIIYLLGKGYEEA